MPNGHYSPWPCYTREEADAVADVLMSNRVNYWTGEEGRAFESEFANFVGVEHAIAVSNGTAALELALIGLGVGAGDEVVVTPRTFMASVSSIVRVGAVPVFADVDPDSQNITAATARAALSSRTRAIMAVHLAGWPCEMDGLMGLAEEHGLHVIEDCAQAHGASYRGRSVGSIGHVGAWSFCQDKIVSTGGEGGMITTNDSELWERMWSYKDHGKSWDAVHDRHHPAGFRWLHDSFGTNWRLTEMQAAIGRLQLQRLPGWSRSRRAHLERIWHAARQCHGVRAPMVPNHLVHAGYKAYVFIKPQALGQGWSRDRIIGEIQRRGVPCLSGSCPEVYREKAFDGTGWQPQQSLPVARQLGETSLMFLIHPTLIKEEIEFASEVLADTLRLAFR